MNFIRQILVLIEEPILRDAVIRYSVELSKRLDSTLVILLIDEDADLDKTRIVFENSINKYQELLDKEGIQIEVNYYNGSSTSEVIKFLAQRGGFISAVWGGNPDVFLCSKKSKKSHWICNVKDFFNCPVVVPSLK